MAQIIAVAWSFIKEVWRLRLLMLFIGFFLLAATGGFALWLSGSDGLANEKLQTFIGYSLRFIMWFLSLLTIFLGVVTITRDIKQQQIFTITTKPITRGQYLWGKFVGLAVFNALLLIISLGAIYGLVRVLERTEPRNEIERLRIRHQVLVAREGVKPILPDIHKEAHEKTLQIMADYVREQGIKDEGEKQTLYQKTYPEVSKQLMMRYTSVGPNQAIVFRFEGIEPLNKDEGYLFVRYKQEVTNTPEDQTVLNYWVYGPQDPQSAGGVQDMDKTTVRTMHELAVDVKAISPAGEFYLGYMNHPSNNTVVIFPPENGLEVLYVAGHFEANLVRAMGLIFLRLLFLSILSLAAGAWVSMPVAILLSLVVYFLGLASNFILEAVQYDTNELQANLISIAIRLFPNLAAADPTALIEKGRMVRSSLLTEAALYLLLLKGGLAGALGYLIFRFRELARVIV